MNEVFDDVGLFMQDIDSAEGSVKIAKLLWAIEKQKEKHAQYKAIRKKYQEHFSRVLEKIEKQTKWLEDEIVVLLEADNLKNLALPEGTVFLRKQETVYWPEDEATLAYMEKHGIPAKVHKRLSPDKMAVKALARETGEWPEGTIVDHTVKLGFKSNRIEVKEVPDELPF